MNLFKTNILLIALAFSLNANAANFCATLFRNERVPPTVAAETESLSVAERAVEKFKVVNLKPAEITAIKNLTTPLGVTAVSTDVNQLSKNIIAKLPANLTDPVARSNKFAEVTQEVYKVMEKRLTDFFVENNLGSTDEVSLYNLKKETLAAKVKEKNPTLSEAKLKEVTEAKFLEYHESKLALLKSKYIFGEHIAKIEAFNISEYRQLDTNSLSTEGYVLLSHKEYPEYAMALAQRNSYPRNFGDGGVLSAEEYRDVVSSNMWLFTAEGHDDKHIHFAQSHPMASITFFRASRSKNHLRFSLVAGMQEGVDDFQYYWETKIAQYYDNRGFSLERAMLDIGSMTQAQLENLSEIVGQDGSDYEDIDWKPALVKKENIPANVPRPEDYEKSLVRFLHKALKDLRNNNINEYMRPDLFDEGSIVLPAGYYHKPLEEIHF